MHLQIFGSDPYPSARVINDHVGEAYSPFLGVTGVAYHMAARLGSMRDQVNIVAWSTCTMRIVGSCG